jgi:hypothetical protein
VPAEPPQLYAVVTDDGRLVLLDHAGHVQRELAFHGDPRERDELGMASYIDAVDVSPDGEWVYYSTCCEPAVGTAYRVPAAGGDAEQIAQGHAPAVSPDGRWLALAGADGMLFVVDLRGDRDPMTGEVGGCCAASAAWSPDSARLAVVVDDGAPATEPQVVELELDGTTLVADHPRPGSFAHYLPDGSLLVLDPANPTGLAALSTDASGWWILELTTTGVLRYRSAESLDSPPVELGRGYIAAGW